MNENLEKHLNQLNSRYVKDKELSRFLSVLNVETSKAEKKKLFDCFLRKIDLSTKQAILIAESETIKYSIDLQYSFKRYIKDREYEEAKNNKSKASDWLYVLGLLGGGW